MSVQILDIVLYSHDGRKRVLPLKPGKVNIVTGASQTGKSALSDIIDYCFGSSECHVAHGPLRLCVAWYGLRLQLASGQAFVARRCPPPRAQSSTDYFIATGRTVEVPEAGELRPTTNLEGAMRTLTSWVGIRDNLHEPPVGQRRAALSATVRHAVALCLQQQDEIISKKHLFHGTTDTWAAQALKDTSHISSGRLTMTMLGSKVSFVACANSSAPSNVGLQRSLPCAAMARPRPMRSSHRPVTPASHRK